MKPKTLVYGSWEIPRPQLQPDRHVCIWNSPLSPSATAMVVVRSSRKMQRNKRDMIINKKKCLIRTPRNYYLFWVVYNIQYVYTKNAFKNKPSRRRPADTMFLSPKKLKNKEQFLVIPRGQKNQLFPSPSVMVRRLFNSFVV